MKSRVTLKTAMNVTKYATTPIVSWPLPTGASASEILWRNLYWTFSILNAICVSTSSCYKIYLHLDDADVIIKVSSEISATIAIIARMVICKIEATRLRTLLAEVDTFLSRATEMEAKVIQLHVDRCLNAHTLVYTGVVVGVSVHVIGPLLLTNRTLPGDTAYPFSIESLWIWVPLYVSHSVVIVQIGSMAITDCMFSILLWFSGARLEILCVELEQSENVDDIRRCAKKYRELLDYIKEVTGTTRIMASSVSSLILFGIVTAGFILTRSPPLFVIVKYVFFETVAALELFLFSWPADYLIEMGEKVGYAAYTCAWIGKSPKMIKIICMIAQRSQIPLKIAVAGILPTLSLEFYGTVMSAAFSYTTTLRAVTDD